MTDYALPPPLAAKLEKVRPLPEQNLISAVMCRAIVDIFPEISFSNSYMVNPTKRRRITRASSNLHRQINVIGKEALRWLYSESTKPFSFLWCREALNLNPVSVRRSIDRSLEACMAKKKGGKKGGKGGKGC